MVKTEKIEIAMNITDIKVAEKLMEKVLVNLIKDRINRFPIEHRRDIYEEILQVRNNNLVNDNQKVQTIKE